jgi:hypothetical protein
MAIDLKTLSKPNGVRPIIATIFGEGGMGKTTLAAMFPAPVFIRTEDGTASLVGNDDVALFPIAQSSQDVLDAIEALATQDHAYKTVVIDSITQLATLIEHEIVEADPKAKAINQAGGGYGAGYNTAAERHRRVTATVSPRSTRPISSDSWFLACANGMFIMARLLNKVASFFLRLWPSRGKRRLCDPVQVLPASCCRKSW